MVSEESLEAFDFLVLLEFFNELMVSCIFWVIVTYVSRDIFLVQEGTLEGFVNFAVLGGGREDSVEGEV